MNVFMQTFFKNGGIACDLGAIKEAQSILLFGGFVENFNEILGSVKFKIDSKRNSVFLLHPLHFNPYGFTQFVYEVGTEEAIVALLAYGLSSFGGSTLQDFAKTLDIGYLASECNFSEEELEQISQSYEKCGLTLLVGADLATHKNAENIAKILALLSVTLKDLKLIFLESKVENTLLKCPTIKSLEELKNYDGLVVYVQENPKKNNVLEVSKQFCMVSKTQEGVEVKVKLESNQEVLAKMQCNAELKGMVGILWASREVLQNGFCYQLVSLSKVA